MMTAVAFSLYKSMQRLMNTSCLSNSLYNTGKPPRWLFSFSWRTSKLSSSRLWRKPRRSLRCQEGRMVCLCWSVLCSSRPTWGWCPSSTTRPNLATPWQEAKLDFETHCGASFQGHVIWCGAGQSSEALDNQSEEVGSTRMVENWRCTGGLSCSENKNTQAKLIWHR